MQSFARIPELSWTSHSIGLAGSFHSFFLLAFLGSSWAIRGMSDLIAGLSCQSFSLKKMFYDDIYVELDECRKVLDWLSSTIQRDHICILERWLITHDLPEKDLVLISNWKDSLWHCGGCKYRSRYWNPTEMIFKQSTCVLPTTKLSLQPYIFCAGVQGIVEKIWHVILPKETTSSWWLNQPIWKNIRQNWFIYFPRKSGWVKTTKIFETATTYQ